MLFEKLIPKGYYVKSEVCALEICFREDGVDFYYSLLKHSKSKLELLETGFSNNRLDLPKAVLKNKIPLVVIINGKGVIMKKIDLSSTGEDIFENTIRENLPTINRDDFYIQVYKLNDSGA